MNESIVTIFSGLFWKETKSGNRLCVYKNMSVCFLNGMECVAAVETNIVETMFRKCKVQHE